MISSFASFSLSAGPGAVVVVYRPRGVGIVATGQLGFLKGLLSARSSVTPSTQRGEKKRRYSRFQGDKHLALFPNSGREFSPFEIPVINLDFPELTIVRKNSTRKHTIDFETQHLTCVTMCCWLMKLRRSI